WRLCRAARSRQPEQAEALAWRTELRNANDQPTGYVIVARPLDANLLYRLANASGVEVVLLDDRDPPLSTVSSKRARGLVATIAGLRDRQVQQTEDGWYSSVLEPSRGQPLRLLLATYRGEEQSLFAVLLASVVIAGVLAIVAAWWLAGSTT